MCSLTHWNTFFLFQLEKDERSDEESEPEEDDKEQEENVNQDGSCCWDRSKDSLNTKLSRLTNSCVLNNLTNHRASAADRMRKAQWRFLYIYVVQRKP